MLHPCSTCRRFIRESDPCPFCAKARARGTVVAFAFALGACHGAAPPAENTEPPVPIVAAPQPDVAPEVTPPVVPDEPQDPPAPEPVVQDPVPTPVPTAPTTVTPPPRPMIMRYGLSPRLPPPNPPKPKTP
jgi:hypothetical protein